MYIVCFFVAFYNASASITRSACASSAVATAITSSLVGRGKPHGRYISDNCFPMSPLVQVHATAVCRMLACQFMMVAKQSHRSRNCDRATGCVRSRDRTGSAAGSISTLRSNPMGPQEHMDWMSALEVVVVKNRNT